MNWYVWLATYQYDADFGNDTIELMQQAYIAGLQTAYDQMYTNEDGDWDFVMWRLKNLIEESK